MPLAAASVLNSLSHTSKFPPQPAALAADMVATTSVPAANELKKGRKFIMSPPRKRFADKKVAPADEMSRPTAAKTRLRVIARTACDEAIQFCRTQRPHPEGAGRRAGFEG